MAYDGGRYRVNRIVRGETIIGNLSVSLMGGIQPTRLAELQRLTNDGLLQRFIPVMVAPTKFRQDRPSQHEPYSKLVHQMIFARPTRLIMTDDALAIMDDLHRHLYDLETASEGLAAGFQTFVGKLPGVSGSLALVLHMAHHLAHYPELAGSGVADRVTDQTVECVSRLVLDFILPHAYEFYCGAGATDGERLRRLASWILTAGKDRVVASDLTTNIADFRGLTLRDVNDRVSPLVAFGWLQPADKSPTCRSWTVTPKVHIELAGRAQSEEARKTALARLMGSPRKS